MGCPPGHRGRPPRPATVPGQRALPARPATVPGLGHSNRPRVVHQSRPRPRVRLASGAAGAGQLGISVEPHQNHLRTRSRTTWQACRTSRTGPLVLMNLKALIFFTWKSYGSTGSTRLPRGSTPGSKVVLRWFQGSLRKVYLGSRRWKRAPRIATNHIRSNSEPQVA